MLHKQETNNYNNILWPKLNYVIVTSCVLFTNVFILCQSLGGGKITSQAFGISHCIPGSGPSTLIKGIFGKTMLPSNMALRVTLLVSISLRNL